ncbi:hypothetical protein ABPG72_001541 [Tetrahymena utriculariae]
MKNINNQIKLTRIIQNLGGNSRSKSKKVQKKEIFSSQKQILRQLKIFYFIKLNTKCEDQFVIKIFFCLKKLVQFNFLEKKYTNQLTNQKTNQLENLILLQMIKFAFYLIRAFQKQLDNYFQQSN